MKKIRMNDDNFPEMSLNEWADINVRDFVYKRKANARQKLHRAVKLGLIHKELCSECSDPLVEAHHPDYTLPYKVIWLCHIHHMALHKEAWNFQREYRAYARFRPIEEILDRL